MKLFADKRNCDSAVGVDQLIFLFFRKCVISFLAMNHSKLEIFFFFFSLILRPPNNFVKRFISLACIGQIRDRFLSVK